jgi:transcriptional regulator with XRE-family HTH domain
MKLLQKLREERGWSKTVAGHKAWINPNRVGQMELGRIAPPPGSVELKRLAKAFGLPASDGDLLLEEVDDHAG